MFEKMYFLFEKPLELSFQLYALIEITIFFKKNRTDFLIFGYLLCEDLIRLLQ